MELTKERVVLIIWGAVAVACLGLYLFLYHPLLVKLRLKYAECRLAEEEILTARNNVSILKTNQAGKKFVVLGEVSIAMDELTKKGKSKGINFISITPQPVEKVSGVYKILPIEMETESTYEALGSFLGCLDELAKSLVTVRSFEVTAEEKDDSKLKMKLMVNMYLAG